MYRLSFENASRQLNLCLHCKLLREHCLSKHEKCTVGDVYSQPRLLETDNLDARIDWNFVLPKLPHGTKCKI